MLKEIVLEEINQTNELTIDDCKKLIDLGFSETTTIKDLIKREEYKNYIKQYELLYPQNPFVTNENIREILVENELLDFESTKKYGYLIPYKNIKEILNFKIKKEFFGDGFWNGDNLTKAYFHVLAPKTMFVNRATAAFDPDPIVFCEVKGGFLMVTSWGEESNLISNPKIN